MSRILIPLLLLILPLAVGAFLLVSEVRGEEAADATAKKALEAVEARGRTLWKKSWRRGAKACMSCHLRGPNRMTSRRAASYPKYDKTLRKVVTVQEKINQMIKFKSGGKPMKLGSADLTALEAHLKTLK